MSLLRRWFDPIRSKWYDQQSHTQADLPVGQGIRLFLRLDDVYSYLTVQYLQQLDEILVDAIKPLQIMICTQTATPANGMSLGAWQQYALKDAKILAQQHRFSYDELPELPASEAIQQAHFILERTQLKAADFLYLLEDIFHMLWQQQYGKLNMLYQMSKTQAMNLQDRQFAFSDAPILTAKFELAGRSYHAIDDLLRFTRRLQQQKLLSAQPIFLINHIEWGEHLIHDAEDLSQIQALHAELDLYLALEDPISWLLLAYIQDELATLYNIKLTVYPLPYQARDQFDWSLAKRLSKRTGVEFAPFCRPDAQSVLAMAQAFYQLDDSQQLEGLLEMLRQTWTRGADLGQARQLKHVLKNFSRRPAEQLSQINSRLAANQQQCDAFNQPDLPVMQLRVDGQSVVFNSLYRVWMIESIFSNLLEQQIKPAYQQQQPD